jgi:TonB family protein
MESAAKGPSRHLPALIISLALHSVFFASVFLFGTRLMVKVIATSGTSHAIRITLPNSQFAAHTRTPDAHADSAKKTPLPMDIPPQKKSGGGSTKDPHHGDGSGNATFSNGADAEDVRPAFPVFSPHPPVADRSLLPNSPQKVVVDVDVDASGQVVSEKLVRGMGSKLDQIVLETVKTWRFQPATVNGKPVPTEAELIFPFNLDYPIAGS